MRKSVIIAAFLFALPLLCAAQPDVVRILAVGNSFSEDAVDQNLHELCAAAGKRVVIGDLYIPGCSLERHALNARTDSAAYRYRRIGLDGRTIESSPVTLAAALADDEWDYISFQQASHFSGLYDTYAPLAELMDSVRSVAGAAPRFVWHQTWAYSPDSKHGAFPTYGSSQAMMYDSIASATAKVVRDYPQLCAVVPSGAAVQTARAMSGNPDLTRDGYHLDRLLGRYIAACAWFEALFGEPVTDNTYAPAGLDPELARLAREAAHAACGQLRNTEKCR